MLRKIIIFTLITASFSLNATDLSVFFNVGSVGAEFSGRDRVINGYFGLPSLYIFCKDSNIGLNIDSPSFSFGEDYEYATFFRTKLYWSPIIHNDLIILGPYADFALGYDNSYDIKSRLGVKYSMFYTFKESKHYSPFKMKIVDIEAGYSIFDNQFHFSCTTDLIITLVGMFYIIVD